MAQLPQLPQRLREAADAHRPDRERMLARVERAIATPGCEPADLAAATAATAAAREHSPAAWMRVTAVAAAVAGAIAIGGLAVGAVGGDGTPGRDAVTSGAATSARPRPQPAESATSGSAARSRTTEKHARPGHSAPGTRHTPGHASGSAAGPTSGSASGAPAAPGGSTPSAPAAGSGGVTSNGSVDPNSNPYWTEDDVNLTSTVALTSLTVELRVSGRSGGVSDNSSYTSATGITTTVSTSGGDLVYRWTLNPDQTLPPGTYTFAGQFNHASRDRATTADRYTVTAGGAAGPASSSGAF
ncbi:hypothetical protein [Streptomyces sp. NBC_00448]|uniref:hypothetical protein n=1 Tax=Streptomyces sp. NBC_00448 TaxID=2903652 RepID=UPI002E1DB61F